jgi:hypothetical protein
VNIVSGQSEISAEQVARWMVGQFRNSDYLYQQVAVSNIQTIFGAQFVYRNRAGNQAIDKRVLRAFKKLTGDAVVWERGQRVWRKRHSYDAAGRQQR